MLAEFTAMARAEWRPSLMQVKTTTPPACAAAHSLSRSSANTRSPHEGPCDVLRVDTFDIAILTLVIRTLTPESGGVKGRLPDVGWGRSPMANPRDVTGQEKTPDGIAIRGITTLTKQDSCSVSFGFECQPVCLTKPFHHGLERREHRCRQSNDGSDRNADRPSRSFWPIRHRQAGDQSTNHLPTLEQQLIRRSVQRLEGDLEIARHELPCRISP